MHLWHEGILFLGTGIQNAPHGHFTASVVIGLDGRFAFRAGRGKWQLLRGIAVAPNVQQQMDCRGTQVAILQIDPETDAYARMARLFAQHGPVVELADATLEPLIGLAGALGAGPDSDPARLWAESASGRQDRRGMVIPGVERQRSVGRSVDRRQRAHRLTRTLPPGADSLG